MPQSIWWGSHAEVPLSNERRKNLDSSGKEGDTVPGCVVEELPQHLQANADTLLYKGTAVKALYLFEKSGAVVEIVPGSEFKSKQYGKCVTVRKVPQVNGAMDMFVPLNALKKLTALEKGSYIHKCLEDVLKIV